MSTGMNQRGVSYGADTSAPDPQGSLQRMIARRAYERWVAKERRSGTAIQDWLEAEAEVKAELSRKRWSELCKTLMPAEIVPH